MSAEDFYVDGKLDATLIAASVAEHRVIASAIATGDAELAAHATHVHLHNALTSILDTLNVPTPDTTEATA